MNRETALKYVGHVVDTALNGRMVGSDQHAEVRDGSQHKYRSVLVGWQCGFEPIFSAVHCAYDCQVSEEEATELATEYAEECDWFAGVPTSPDFVIS